MLGLVSLPHYLFTGTARVSAWLAGDYGAWWWWLGGMIVRVSIIVLIFITNDCKTYALSFA
jgi:hypothetical protein